MSIIDRAAEVIVDEGLLTSRRRCYAIATALASAGLLASEPRMITTEAEAEALPRGTIVRLHDGRAAERARNCWFVAGYHEGRRLRVNDDAPLAVLYVPEADHG